MHRGVRPRARRTAGRSTSTARTSTRSWASQQPGESRRRREPPQPAQDLLHPARRRRARRRAGVRGRRRPGALPARHATAPAAGVSAARRTGAAVRRLGNAGCRSAGCTSRMMGAEGLQARHRGRDAERPTTSRRASPDHYHIHFSGQVDHGRAWRRRGARVHPRPAPAQGGFRGVGAEDVAKRLIDYGFHAPTLSRSRWLAP